MKKGFVRILSGLVAAAMLFGSAAFAHSGRTDSSGGHKDNKNKSGLGSYHYHCGGYPAHLHDGGVCPYAPKPKKTAAPEVKKNNVERIELEASRTQSEVGSVLKVYADVQPESAENKALRWESGNENVAIVTTDGIVILVGEGEAKITASAMDGSGTKGSVTIRSESGGAVDAAYIRSQLPQGYVLAVQPGSMAAGFASTYGLPWEYDLPDELPLKKGSRGEAVKVVQQALIDAGYLNDRADGIFGNNTNYAAASFCEAEGILYSGSIDADIYIAIFENGFGW